MKDPYEVLGVAKTASEAEIKKAFRTLAKKHHPDKHAGDAAAQKRFQEISGAYDILGDKEKRAQFDAGAIGPDGNPRGFDPRPGRRRLSPGQSVWPGLWRRWRTGRARISFQLRRCAAGRRGRLRGHLRRPDGRARPRRAPAPPDQGRGFYRRRDRQLRRSRHRRHPPGGAAEWRADRRQDSGGRERRPDHPGRRAAAAPAGAAAPMATSCSPCRWRPIPP